MRAQEYADTNGVGDDYYDGDAPAQPYADTNMQAPQAAAEPYSPARAGGKCPACGAASPGDTCPFCGTRIY